MRFATFARRITSAFTLLAALLAAAIAPGGERQPDKQTHTQAINRTIAFLNSEVTWWNGSDGYDPSNLDHVVASEHMDIRSDGGGANNIAVLGWPKLPEAQWDNWLETVSDHALLYFEVWK